MKGGQEKENKTHHLVNELVEICFNVFFLNEANLGGERASDIPPFALMVPAGEATVARFHSLA